MTRAVFALALVALALVAAPLAASSPLVVSPESGAAPLVLRPEAGGFSGRFTVENRGATAVRASVRPRPGSSTVPRVPASVGAAFEGGRAEATLAPGQKLAVVVRWIVREPSPQHLYGHVMVETEAGDTAMMGVRAERPRSFLLDHALPLLFLLPLLGVGALVALHLARYDKLRNLRFVAAAVALVQIGLGGLLYTSFDVGLSRYHGGDGFQFVQAAPLVPALGIQYLVGIDGVSIVPLLLVPVVLLLAALVADSVSHRLVAFWCWMLALEAGVIGALIALDLALFIAAFSVASLALVALVGGWSGSGRHGTRAALYFAVSAAAVALALFLLAGHSGTTYLLDGSAVGRSFSFFELVRVDFLGSGLAGKGTVKLAWVLLFVGFAIPLAAVPFHGWLLAALRSAPAALGMLLVGSVVPLGVYGLVRFGYGLLPDGTLWASTTLGALGVAGALWAAIAAVAERDLGRFVGYATALHAGTALLSLSGLTGIAVEGALAQSVGHALAAAGLLAVVGALRDRVGSADSARLGGLAGDAPLLAALAGVAFAGSMALPGTLAFVGQAMGVVGALPRHPALVLAMACVAVASGAAHVAAYSRTFFGEVPEAWRQSRHLEPHGGRFPELVPRELGALAVAAALVLVLGLAPQLLLRLSDSSALDHAERVSPPGPTEVAWAPTFSQPPVLALNSPVD